MLKYFWHWSFNATALTALFHRERFSKSDAFIAFTAFMGLDVRVRESGHFKGKRKLTKKGSPEMRRLLFNAAELVQKQSNGMPIISQ